MTIITAFLATPAQKVVLFRVHSKVNIAYRALWPTVELARPPELKNVLSRGQSLLMDSWAHLFSTAVRTALYPYSPVAATATLFHAISGVDVGDVPGTFWRGPAPKFPVADLLAAVVAALVLFVPFVLFVRATVNKSTRQQTERKQRKNLYAQPNILVNWYGFFANYHSGEYVLA